VLGVDGGEGRCFEDLPLSTMDERTATILNTARLPM
jgi:hypothetical protein